MKENWIPHAQCQVCRRIFPVTHSSNRIGLNRCKHYVITYPIFLKEADRKDDSEDVFDMEDREDLYQKVCQIKKI